MSQYELPLHRFCCKPLRAKVFQLLQTGSRSAWNCFRAQSHLEEVLPQGRAVDKAFKRELGPLPYYPELLLLYQDRSRGYTYQADFRMAELDELMTASTSPVPLQEQQRMQAPVLGYAPSGPLPSTLLASLLLPLLSTACHTYSLHVLSWVI